MNKRIQQLILLFFILGFMWAIVNNFWLVYNETSIQIKPSFSPEFSFYFIYFLLAGIGFLITAKFANNRFDKTILVIAAIIFLKNSCLELLSEEDISYVTLSTSTIINFILLIFCLMLLTQLSRDKVSQSR